MQPIILIHASELSSSVNEQRHVACLQEALPRAELAVWDGTPPRLRGRQVIKTGNSPFLGSAVFADLEAALGQCERAFVAVDDYTYPPATQVRRALLGKQNVVVSSCPTLLEDNKHKASWAWATRQIYVNWNRASWELKPMRHATHDGIFYYGVFREDRIEDFTHYFDTDKYDVHISARSTKQLRKFEDHCALFPRMKSYAVLDFEDFQHFPATLYLEDNKTHDQYHSLANRFYECLGLGVAQFFDISCRETLIRAGIYEEARRWTVASDEDVAFLLPQADAIRKKQRALWAARDYRTELVRELRGLFKKEGLC
jgi:hypothetical protein